MHRRDLRGGSRWQKLVRKKCRASTSKTSSEPGTEKNDTMTQHVPMSSLWTTLKKNNTAFFSKNELIGIQ
jgi:hypothetical protein